MNKFKEQVFACPCARCRALVNLVENGATLQFSRERAGRLCEMAVVAAAGDEGIHEGAVVAARREYAKHLGIELSGSVQDGDRPGHIEWAIKNNNHVPNAAQPINLGRAVPTKRQGRFYLGLGC